jgi:hypothetical protein
LGSGITWGIVVSLTGLGEVAAALGHEERAAKLLGATEVLLTTMNVRLEADDRIPYEQGIASARAQLGDEAFEKALRDGRTMSMEEAIKYAMEETS